LPRLTASNAYDYLRQQYEQLKLNLPLHIFSIHLLNIVYW